MKDSNTLDQEDFMWLHLFWKNPYWELDFLTAYLDFLHEHSLIGQGEDRWVLVSIKERHCYLLVLVQGIE